MKEIKVEVTKYVAQDGTRFDDKESCEKHDAECIQNEADCETRIAMIRNKRKSLDDAAAEKARRDKLEYENRKMEIREIGHKIRNLISVANELIDCNLFPRIGDFYYGWLDKYGYHYGNKIHFRTSRGFAYKNDCDWHLDEHVAFIGVNGLGVLVTDGDYIDGGDNGDASNATMAGWLLEDFPKFEKAFYSYVDEKTK